MRVKQERWKCGVVAPVTCENGRASTLGLTRAFLPDSVLPAIDYDQRGM